MKSGPTFPDQPGRGPAGARGILLTHAIHPLAQARLAELGSVRVAPDTSFDTLRRSARDCTVVVVRAPLPDDIFAAAPTLLGAVRHGAGVDMIPLEAATAHGVLVANVPGVNAGTVAEHVMGAMVRLARGGTAVTAALTAGRSAGWASARAIADAGFELAGRTVGLVGYGHVGRAIARVCAAGLGMRVLAHTRSGIPDGESWASPATLPEVLQQADFLVLACPLTASTRGLIGGAQLAMLRRTAFLINVARGPVVQEAALIEALRAGQLAGAALDVFDTQPLPDDHPWWQMPQVLISPHVAGISADSMLRMGHGAAQAVADLLRGEVPAHCINPQAIAAFRQRLVDAGRAG
jgi:D-3-phosphoglycerate dehydrogenase